MTEAMNNWSVQVAGMALISAAATAVFWVAEGSKRPGLSRSS